jgi:hypothetical protein
VQENNSNANVVRFATAKGVLEQKRYLQANNDTMDEKNTTLKTNATFNASLSRTTPAKLKTIVQ